MNGEAKVNKIGPLDKAGPGSHLISSITLKYEPQLYTTKAEAVISQSETTVKSKPVEAVH